MANPNPLALLMFPVHMASAVLIVAVLAVFSIVLGGKRWTFNVSRQSAYSFTGRPLMSAAEIRFFRVLQMAAPNELIFPQVGMAAVVRPRQSEGEPGYIAAFRTMSQKRIDFVVCHRESLEVRCLVELDDSTHDARRDRDRDAITAKAGYRTIRVRAARRYDIDGLRRQVFKLPPEQARLSG